MERKNYTVAVDLGSSNVVVAVGEKNAEERLDVVCVVSKPVEGVNAGKIENIELVSRAIREAVSEAEEQLGIRITEAYAGISGDFVRCARHMDHVFVYDPQNGVNQKDVDALFDRMRNVQAPDDETIMDRVPQNYVVDDNQEVKNPVGSFGKKLSSTFNFILCLKTPMQRLDMALKRVGIKMLSVTSNAIATAEAVLLPDEKEEGVAVVDIGGGVTDVAVYYRNVPRYIATIPMGAGAINNDIRTLGILERHVDSLKRKFGSAVAELAPENKMVSVKGRTAKETKDILLHNLAVVIESRARDIAEYVAQEIRDSGFGDKLAYGIVLTGGSAQLQHIDELFRRVTGMEVRIGTAEEAVDETSREKVASPAYSTAVGLLLRGAAHGDCAVTDIPRQGGAAQPAGPTIPRATPYSAGKPATGVSAAPYTPRPAAAPTPPPTTPAANAATEGAAQGAAAETAETPHRPKRGLLDKLKQKLGTRLDDFFTGSEDEEI